MQFHYFFFFFKIAEAVFKKVHYAFLKHTQCSAVHVEISIHNNALDKLYSDSCCISVKVIMSILHSNLNV